MGSIKSYGRFNYAPYKLYIPENLDIDKLLSDHPPAFRGVPKSYRNYRDKFVYILHLINSIPNETKDFDYDFHRGFTPITKEYLKNRICNYRSYIDYLKLHQIVIEGTSYDRGKYARGLKFTDKYKTPVRVVKIATGSLIKSIVAGNRKRDIDAEKKLHFLKGWFNQNLEIDYNTALARLIEDLPNARKKAINKRSKRYYSRNRQPQNLPSIEEVVKNSFISNHGTILRIKEKDYRTSLKIDLTSGRFHSPLTRLKKVARPAISYAGERLVSIDITNSQPFFSRIILDINIMRKGEIKDIIANFNPSYKAIGSKSSYAKHLAFLLKNKENEDLLQFKKITAEGLYYEYFSTVLLERNLVPKDILEITDESFKKKEIRGFAKDATFSAFFDKVNSASYSPYAKAFKECFPTVYEIFLLVKRGYRTRLNWQQKHERQSVHNTLACSLQKFEANIVLHCTCVEINRRNANIPIFTVHDSIVTTAQYGDLVLEVFKKNLYEHMGVIPMLHKEEW